MNAWCFLQCCFSVVYDQSVIRCFFFNKLLKKLRNICVIFDDQDCRVPWTLSCWRNNLSWHDELLFRMQ